MNEILWIYGCLNELEGNFGWNLTMQGINFLSNPPPPRYK